MPTRFLYFDLGNVLLTFSNERACSQIAATAGLGVEQVAGFILGPHESKSLLWRFEHGIVSEEEFYTAFCQEFGVTPDQQTLDMAASDMFAPIEPSFALIERLHASGRRLGVLSNTNPVHWRFVTDRYPLINDCFEQWVTSFAAMSMKPARRIYEVAIDAAGVEPGEVFFVDDREENVAGAIEAGIDAVQYRDHETLVADLATRGVRDR